MAISQPPFQSTLVDANDRVQTPWAQWFSQLQPILQSVVASGPTSGRPTQNLYIGYPYFDTTIDQMIYWNGVIWVTYAPSTTGTSILKGNGSGGVNNAVAGVDFAPATSGAAILYGNGAGGFSSVAIGAGVTFAGGILSAVGSGGTITAVTGTAPIASSGGSTPAISISQADASTNGYLSSADWNIFNAKGSGTVTSISGTGTVNGITLTGTVTSSGNLTLGGTLSGIGNSQLTNSSITINGSTVSLGGSTTVTATATNALTIGTGLSGTSYNGSTAVTIANTGVLSIAGTALQITASASTGAVTLSLPSSINVNTTGYAAGLAGGGANYVPYQTAVNTTGFVSPGVVGQVFTSTGSGSAPNWQNATSPPGSPGYYGAWHDTSTVTATSSATAYVMNIGSIDLENGISIVGGTKLTVANTAVYNLQFSSQLSNPNAAIANVSIWIRLNGVNVTDGAGTNGVPAKHGSYDGLQIISWNYVLNLTAGDYIELVWHSDTTGVQLITFPATTSPAVPESPSLIVTIQAVTQIGIGYQGLTSETSVLIATGSKVFTTNFTNSQTAFAIGTRVRVAYSSIPADFMEGVVTAFSGTTFTVLVDSIGGSGTFASWTISVAGIQGSNGVTSFSGNSTGLTPSTATTGAITLAGTLVTANGGTGLTSVGTNGQVLTSNGTALSYTTPTTGTVTSVAGTGTVNGITLTGTVTSSGSLTLGGTLGSIANSQLTNSSITFGATAQALGSTVSALNAVTIGASSQTTGAFTTVNATTGMGIGSLGTSSLNIATTPAITDSFMVSNAPTYTSANTFGTIYYSQPTIASGGALTNVSHYRVGQGTFTGTATNQYGFAVNAPMVGATNNYAFYGNLPQATGNWNIYATGAGANYFGGNVLLGTTTQPTTSNNLVVAGLQATSAAAPTIASATTIAPTKAITFISGVTPIVTITAPNPISAGGGQITLIPTGIFTTTIAGNIALASTAVVGKALIMTYDTTKAKWYPSY